MTKTNETIVYLYAQSAEMIHRLKTDAYKSTTYEKYAYRSPDGKTFCNKRPDQKFMDAGWIYAKVKFQRVDSYMSPRHARWQEYRNTKRRATVLLAARLILKAANETVPEKSKIGSLLSIGIFRSHARTSSSQKSLAYSAYRLLRKLDNRLRNQPERLAGMEAWLKQRGERKATYV